MESVRQIVRKGVRAVAKGFNKATEGTVSPNSITLFGLVMHIPIALLIAAGDLLAAAIFLVIFGLLDTMDGELARIQNRASKYGMLLDSVTDRVKEILIYTAIGFYFVSIHEPQFAVWAVTACGISLLVSYINAWGEAVSANDSETNKRFRLGFMSFDVRMFTLVVGLAFSWLEWVLPIIVVLSALTALQRFMLIGKKVR